MWNPGFKLGLGDTLKGLVCCFGIYLSHADTCVCYRLTDSRLSVWNTWSEILIFLLHKWKAHTASVFVRVSIAVKRHHDHGNSYKGKHLIAVAYSSEI